MNPFERCPVCGGELTERQVEKVVLGGNNTAVLSVRAEVCLGCGERLYDERDVLRFERIRKKLESQETEEFKVIGHTFQVV